jgi:hypothetical protein
MVLMMVLMMGLMIVFAIAVVFLLPILLAGIARNTDSKAKRTDLEKPKRHPLALGDDGELVEIYEDNAPLFYAGEERQ